MDKQKPNISIIVPIYNVEPFLHRCVDSLLAQTFGDFELILVDDGSPDNCGAVCDEYALADPRVRVIHKPNGGLSDARNAGMEIARGEYIAFVDSDDWVAPEYLEKMLAALIEQNGDICECSVLYSDGENHQVRAVDGEGLCCNGEDALELLIRDHVFRQHVWNKLYRRSVIGDITFPKGRTNEDEFWTWRVFANAGNVLRIRDPLYYYFQRPGSIMGVGYSLKRLDALEAKAERLQFVTKVFPRLEPEARINLLGSCMYAGQMALRNLRGEELAAARRKIDEIRKTVTGSLREAGNSTGARVWFSLARIDFWMTCRLKNLLKKGL